MNHKKIIPLLILLLTISFSTSGWSANIVYPWNATTAIVKVGNSFTIWFNADVNQNVTAVELRSPYLAAVATTMATPKIGTWEYDITSKNTYNRQITVTVPANTPADRYDLIVLTSTGEVISKSAVKVIKNYKVNYTVVHLSDIHLQDVNYRNALLEKRLTAIVNMVNIIDPEIVVSTGDNLYWHTSTFQGRVDMFYEGDESAGFKGLHDLHAATFTLVGNHDFEETEDDWSGDYPRKARFWNKYQGIQAYNFVYGNARFMAINNGWNGYDYNYQFTDVNNWLSGEGAGGNLRVGLYHKWQFEKTWASQNNLDLALSGHNHHKAPGNPWSLGNRGEIEYVGPSILRYGQFNVFRVNDSDGSYSALGEINTDASTSGFGLPTGTFNIIENAQERENPAAWKINLTLDYTEENDGTSYTNTATIVNNFNDTFKDAHVRFVMPKGSVYQINNGVITQQFDGDFFRVVDVKVDLGAASTIVVSIETGDFCPDDPNKLETGLCGCGVAEGTCAPLTLTVNSGSGDGEYFPYEQVSITADIAPEGQEFDTWVVNSGSPSILYLTKTTTSMTVGDETAEITATYKDLPKVNGATFVSQQIPNLVPGETVSVSVTMKNTGTTTWTKNKHFLGTQSPKDNNQWGLNRVGLEEGESVLPEGEKTFMFDITVPTQDGTYIFQWKMLEDGVEWFGDFSSIQPFTIGGSGSSGDYLDDCDAKEDWDPGALILNGTNKVQGSGALEFIGSTTDEYSKVFSPAYDALGTESGTVLQFWYYVSDVSLLLGNNQVEISSSGGPDIDEYSWSLEGLVSGWNFIQLYTSDAAKRGNPDLSAINWFRVYRFKSGSVTTRIDAIQLIGENSLSIDDIIVEKSFNIFPNPADSEFYVNFILPKSSTVSITLMNISGQIVSQRMNRQELNPGTHRLEVPVDTLNSGIYFASIKINDAVFTKKVLIE